MKKNKSSLPHQKNLYIVVSTEEAKKEPSSFLMDKTIDVSNISAEEFVEAMRELDRKTTCPCIGCMKCQVRSQKHECADYQSWVNYKYKKNG